MNGQYTIQSKKGETLLFQYIGYKQEKRVVKSSTLDVKMKADELVLEECVVVGYGHELRATKSMSTAYMAVCPASGIMYNAVNAEEYGEIQENGFKNVSDAPLSTFSIDVDAASYSNMRRFINKGKLPPVDAIRTEELVNYFSYDYPKPTGSDPVKITMEAGTCPWNADHRLVRIGLKAKEIPTDNLPASNLVFLIDVSGSMWGANRLDLVKSSLKLLVNNLRDKDKVAIVTYAGNAGVKLEATPGSDKQKIREAIDELEASGSTAGGEGIMLAYKIAQKNFISGGNNRIILCTDGDFNVGVSSDKELEKLIEQKRKSGIFLTVLGYGMGNYKDSKMQTLAEKGNGNHAYIDNLQEANRVLVNEFGATLHTVAKDVKLQVEFNPAQVQAYRLIGYESRLLADEDFNNDTKDAGEMGAGHTVTAFYEVIPTGVKSDFAGKIDDLKYQKKQKPSTPLNESDELLTIFFCGIGIDDEIVVTGLHSDLLSGQSVLQLINDNGKSDRRRLLSKLFQKMVITSACHNGITGSVSIGPKYNPGIVSIMTAHTQIKGHIIISPIQCKQFINLQKPSHRLFCLIGRCMLNGLFQHIHISCELRKQTERLF